MSEQSDTVMGQISTSTALVVVSDRQVERARFAIATEAGFLTQLIACKAGIGGYRRHRREEPGIASQHYQTSMARSSLTNQSALKTVKVA